ncbi:hypothetical protein V1505DRAFT_376405, partial [Lipomyces doorenjongii]
MFTGVDGQTLRSCRSVVTRKCQLQRRSKNQIGVPTWAGFDLDDETHEEFVEAVSSFLKLHNSHEYVASLQPLRIRATLSATFLVDNGFSIASNGNLMQQTRQ